jgi:hypothetical protein
MAVLGFSFSTYVKILSRSDSANGHKQASRLGRLDLAKCRCTPLLKMCLSVGIFHVNSRIIEGFQYLLSKPRIMRFTAAEKRKRERAFVCSARKQNSNGIRDAAHIVQNSRGPIFYRSIYPGLDERIRRHVGLLGAQPSQ